MTEPRRVRTQVERDADGTAWRVAADSRPGYATWPHTQPGNPSWWRHDVPGDTAQRLADALADIAPYLPERTRFAHLFDPLPDPDIWMTTESIRPPRRRWWHRYTRRNP